MENKKIFPHFIKTTEIVNLLTTIGLNENIEILTERGVKRIAKNDENVARFPDNSTEYSKHLVLSTGEPTYPQTCSTGDEFILEKNFGHKIRPTKFAICCVIAAFSTS